MKRTWCPGSRGSQSPGAAWGRLLALLLSLPACQAAAPDGGTGGDPDDPLIPPAELGVKPAPLSGGTLLIAADGVTALAADPDGDRVFLVDLASRSLRATLALQPGDEPGRAVEGAAGRFYVALRRGGAVVTIDSTARQIVDRRAVCAAPRGLAYDAAAQRLHVACQSGELVTLPAGGGAPLRVLQLDPEQRDLRDVILADGQLYVTRFRSAVLLQVGDDGTISTTFRPPPSTNPDAMGQPIENVPAVAWRTLALPGGQALMLHQRGQRHPVMPGKGGYSGGGKCPGGGIVQGALTTLTLGGGGRTLGSAQIPFGVLPVDAAVSRDGSQVAVVAAGMSSFPKAGPIQIFSMSDATTPGRDCMNFQPQPDVTMTAVAAAYDGASQLWVQTRTPLALRLHDNSGSATTIALADGSKSRGFDLFHQTANAMVACASCHPEGGDDGRVWNFTDIGARRTQSLRGGIMQTAPFHWDGDLDNMRALMAEVFQARMGGSFTGELTDADTTALGQWLDGIPSLPRPQPADRAATQRGQAIFHDAAVGCASCHSGARFTNNTSADVGTGKAFQVPQLTSLAGRAPYMHDGCAATLRDRFSTCGGGDQHGRTAQLSPGQLDDLTAYLHTL